MKDWKDEDFQYFAQNFSYSLLDIDAQTDDSQIGELADYIQEYKTRKSLLTIYLEKHFETVKVLFCPYFLFVFRSKKEG